MCIQIIYLFKFAQLYVPFQPGNDRINVADLRYILCALGDKFTEDEALEVIESAEKDSNGDIAYEGKN